MSVDETLETRVAVLSAQAEERDRRYAERFAAQEEAVRSALTSAKEAVTKAESAAEKRFESLNEFRGQQRDMIGTFIPRKEAEQRIEQVAEKVAGVESRLTAGLSAVNSRLDLMAGQKSGGHSLWMYIVGGIALALSLWSALRPGH
ncbi:MAG TPA: hypothetical protein VNH18_15770 [Bryobacteraceae bacterium]|nr:hypothetical protein [Bryobacteraceae bacterium]